MTTFLGVPIAVRGKIYGNLYLTEKRGEAAFTDGDERAAVTLAAQAGVAIENARLFAEARERRSLQERHRLAQELHDSVLQGLFAMTMNAAAAQMALDEGRAAGEKPQLARHLREMQRLTQSTLAEMRALIFELRPEALSEEGLLAALRKQVERMAAHEEVVFELHCPAGRLSVPSDAEEDLYRIVLEALTNVVKHACATKVLVLVEDWASSLSIRVVDDGIGFNTDVTKPGHLGLRSMAERAGRIGAHLTVKSRPNRGTEIDLRLAKMTDEAVAS